MTGSLIEGDTVEVQQTPSFSKIIKLFGSFEVGQHCFVANFWPIADLRIVLPPAFRIPLLATVPLGTR